MIWHIYQLLMGAFTQIHGIPKDAWALQKVAIFQQATALRRSSA
ncbi:hypothetical protein LJR267_000173 [Paraburkholderia hospita]